MYQSILVHVKPTETWSEHVDLALRLGAAHGARVSALLTERTAALLALLQGEVHPATVRRRQEAAALAEALEARLRARAAELGAELEWLTAEGDAGELLGYLGRAHDLVVVEQTDLARDDIGFDVPERAIAVCGRPVLVVPNTGRFDLPGRRILVGWNASREAALAVQGARPLIAGADQVVVLLGSPRDRLPTVSRLPRLDLAVRLGAPGRPALLEQVTEADADAGAAILAAAARHGADLLVMGAYGRSWFREWVLGGTTRHVLRQMTLPVLMAH